MTINRPPETRSKVNEADLRVRRTRKLLKDAFLELLSERSFDAISVQEIADRAMVNRATFYLHFEDKYRLFDQVMRDMFRRIVDKHLPPESQFSTSHLRLLILATMEACEEINRGCCQAQSPNPALRPLVLAAVQEGLSELLGGWLQQLPRSPDRQPELIATSAAALSWAIFGAGMCWGSGPRTVPADQMADQVARLLTEGLGALVPAGHD